MKKKSILMCIVTMHDGNTFVNPLKLSEVHLISKMAKENASIKVERLEIDEKTYKYHFG